MAIGDLMLEQENYELSPEARELFHEYLGRRMKQPRFANARSVRNALERARLRQASRLLMSDKPKIGKRDVMLIEPEDIARSRVFSDDEGDEAGTDEVESAKSVSAEAEEVETEGTEAEEVETEEAEAASA